jgi:hypothetical protein
MAPKLLNTLKLFFLLQQRIARRFVYYILVIKMTCDVAWTRTDVKKQYPGDVGKHNPCVVPTQLMLKNAIGMFVQAVNGT